MEVDIPFLRMGIQLSVLANRTSYFQKRGPVNSNRTNQHDSSLFVLNRIEKALGSNNGVGEHCGGQASHSSRQMIDGLNPFDSAASIARRSEIANPIVNSCIRITVADLLQGRNIAV